MLKTIGWIGLATILFGCLVGCLGSSEPESAPPPGKRPPTTDMSGQGGREGAALEGREGKGGG